MLNYNEIKELNTKDLKDTLTKYPHILQSMEDEGYEILFNDYYTFKEIKDDENVVGFISFLKHEYYNNIYSINEFYILPEYSQTDLLIREIKELIIKPNFKFSIKKPTKYLVNQLLEHGLAVLLNDNIVISYVDFLVCNNDVFKNKHLRKYNRQNKKMVTNYHFSKMYDINAGCVIYVTYGIYFPRKDNIVLLSNPRSIDESDSLKKIKPQYLKNTAEEIYLNKDKIDELKKDVNDKIDSILSVNNLIGSEDDLLDDIKEKLAENNLTLDDGFRIRKEIFEAVNNGEIKSISILKRFNYLIGNYDNTPKDKLDLKCPYCQNKTSFFNDTCSVCGHDLSSSNTFHEVQFSVTGDPDIYKFHSRTDTIENGENVFKELQKIIYNNNYDYDDVYEIQSRYSCYTLIKEVNESRYKNFAIGHDALNKIREGSGIVYAVNNDLVEEYTKEQYENDLRNNYSIRDLNIELSDYGIEFQSDDREELIERLLQDEPCNRIISTKFVLTDKGLDFIDDEVMEYFNDNVEGNYCFYEFLKEYEKNKNDLSLDEIRQRFELEYREFNIPRFF